LLFSATMPRAIAELAAHMLRDPVNVAVAPVSTTAERIEQRLIRVDRGAKIGVLVGVLQQEAIDRALIFAKTKRGADKIVQSLGRAGIFAEAIHGNKSQNQRERVLAAFRRGTVRILVATDIAARGIDVDGVSHVVNFDLPHVAETYVHRIGRTARAGAAGVAISLCDQDETGSLRDIERLIRMSIPATDRRLNPVHPARPGASANRSAPANDRPAPVSDRPGAGKRSARPPRKRRRGGGGKRPDRQHERHKGPSRGIGSVAFLHRDDAVAGHRTDRAGR
jgi:ATP-dependent RNA helicase RhlE